MGRFALFGRHVAGCVSSAALAGTFAALALATPGAAADLYTEPQGYHPPAAYGPPPAPAYAPAPYVQYAPAPYYRPYPYYYRPYAWGAP